MTLNRFECVLSTLLHEESPVIPQLINFTNEAAKVKFTSLMSLDELKEHLIDRIRTGAPGGGYILGSEGGIPPEMSPEKFEVFLKMSKKYRRMP